jgi:hypothetical protein
MMTENMITEMALGSSFKWGKMFPGISDEYMVWDVIEKGKDYIICTVSYFDTLIGSYTLTLKDGKVVGKEGF